MYGGSTPSSATTDPADLDTVAADKTHRRTVISVSARIAYSARKLTFHLPTGWPWEKPWMMLFESMFRWNILFTA
jgi:hypothetical protein